MRKTVMALLLLGVLATAGCGDGDENATGDREGGGRLSKAEVIAQGDALCAETEEKLAPVFGELFPTGTETPPASEAAGPMRTAATALGEEYDDFSALSPPADDQQAFDALLEKFEAAVGEVERSAELAEAGDTEGYLTALETANGADAESRELMRDFGFDTCAGPAPEADAEDGGQSEPAEGDATES